jgi:methylated-DNA-[protein]-cysteine S-methyltransferase
MGFQVSSANAMAKSDFSARVRSVVRRIPHGCVATYGDVAAAAGRPRAHRAVGNIMRQTSDSSIPCHRVIAAGGKLGGYGRDVFAKRALLLGEGVVVTNGRVRDFRDRRWLIRPSPLKIGR